MHRNAVTNAAILHHEDHDVGLPCHCKMFVFLFSVSVVLSFKKHISQGTPFSGCFQI